VPPLPVVPEVFKVEISGTQGFFKWANIFHFAWSGTAPSPAVCASFAESCYGFWNAEMNAYQHTDVTTDLVKFTDLTSDTASEGEYSGPTPGTRSGELLPGQVAMLVNDLIYRRYRGGHPRSYLVVGVQADLGDPSHWEDSFTTAVQTAFNTFISETNALADSGCSIRTGVNVSYRSGGAVRVAPVVDPILAYTCSSQLATQRRRIGRR
jgi:hypothetical protein